ncbi:hypothetical protein ACS0TY_013871 [Phlomoides rotata]
MHYERSNSESELEETKQSLQRAHEESIHMARCLSSLQQELHQTKRELQKLKSTRKFDSRRTLNREDMEDREITEQVKMEMTSTDGDQNVVVEFQKKKCVTFANPPLVAQVIMPPPLPPRPSEPVVLQSHPSLKKKKKKPLIPFNIGGIFSKKRGSSNSVAFA